VRNGWTTDDPTAIWVAPRSIPIRRFRITSALARLGRQLVRVRPGQGGRWDPTCLLSDRRDEQQPRPDPGGHDRASSCGQRTNMTGPCRLFPARRHVSLGTEVNLNSARLLRRAVLRITRLAPRGRRSTAAVCHAGQARPRLPGRHRPTPWKAPPGEPSPRSQNDGQFWREGGPVMVAWGKKGSNRAGCKRRFSVFSEAA